MEALIYLLVGLVIAYTWSLWENPFKRAALLRRLLKRDYGVVYLLGKGGIIKTAVVDFSKGVVEKDNGLWVITRDRVYNQDTKAEYKLTAENLKFVHGTIPVVFLSYETMKPLAIGGEKTDVKPDELYNALRAWLINKRAQDKAAIAGYDWRLWLILGLVIITAYLVYSTSQDIATMKAQMAEMQKTINTLKAVAIPEANAVVIK